MADPLLTPPPTGLPEVPFEDQVAAARAALPADLPRDLSRVMVALDVDGTLLTEEGASPRVHEAFGDLVDAGATVVIATGRGMNATREVFDYLEGVRGWSVSANGALTIDWNPDLPSGYEVADIIRFEPGPVIDAAQEILPDAYFAASDVLPAGDVAALLDSARPQTGDMARALGSDVPGTTPVGPAASPGTAADAATADLNAVAEMAALGVDDGAVRSARPLNVTDDDLVEIYLLSRTFPPRELHAPLQVVPMDILRNTATTKFVIRQPGMAVPEFQAAVDRMGLDADWEVAVGWTAWADVSPKGCTKASGLLALADRLGIPRDGIVAIGDGTNDVPMFDIAAFSAAMGGATPAVRARASHVTGPVEHDGAAAVMRAILERD